MRTHQSINPVHFLHHRFHRRFSFYPIVAPQFDRNRGTHNRFFALIPTVIATRLRRLWGHRLGRRLTRSSVTRKAKHNSQLGRCKVLKTGNKVRQLQQTVAIQFNATQHCQLLLRSVP